MTVELGKVAHVCNSSYLGVRDSCSKGEIEWLKHNAFTGKIPRQKSHWTMNKHLNKEG
jgi:hypothetical protein